MFVEAKKTESLAIVSGEERDTAEVEKALRLGTHTGKRCGMPDISSCSVSGKHNAIAYLG